MPVSRSSGAGCSGCSGLRERRIDPLDRLARGLRHDAYRAIDWAGSSLPARIVPFCPPCNVSSSSSPASLGSLPEKSYERARLRDYGRSTFVLRTRWSSNAVTASSFTQLATAAGTRCTFSLAARWPGRGSNPVAKIRIVRDGWGYWGLSCSIYQYRELSGLKHRSLHDRLLSG